MRIPYKTILLIGLTANITGCMNAAVTGAQTVYNRHSIAKSLDDQFIAMEAYRALYLDTKRFKNANISIAAYNHELLLAGQAPEPWQKEEAEKIVKQRIPQLSQVYNLIRLASPSSTMTRISDAWITTKVKSKLIASNDVDATQIKVVTENGVVYLMGIVPPFDAQEAVKLASETDGVRSVMKIFSYITISKQMPQSNMEPTPPSEIDVAQADNVEPTAKA